MPDPLTTACNFVVISVEETRFFVYRRMYADEMASGEYAALSAPENMEGVAPNQRAYKVSPTGQFCQTVIMSAQYDGDQDEMSFAAETPFAQLSINCDNPDVVGSFVVGAMYNMVLTPVVS